MNDKIDSRGVIKVAVGPFCPMTARRDRKSTRLNSSHLGISYAVFCLKKKTESVFGCEVLLIGSHTIQFNRLTPVPSHAAACCVLSTQRGMREVVGCVSSLAVTDPRLL